ncbi:hypothetical protein VNO78_26756 [Psophocarpus tetragonolobus]|uniref:Uncharacterized protein n=1 Tax=Psophocarpus tetragonolobus TaxID=3891 RepID=A0AAN9X8X1_PSOTE
MRKLREAYSFHFARFISHLSQIQHLGTNICQQRKVSLDGMVKYSMKKTTTFLQKLEMLSYATEAKYISVEVLPIQSCFKVQPWLSRYVTISKANSTNSSKTKREKFKM